MKGLIYSDFGHPKDVLKLKEVEKPIPLHNQVLIKVRASSLNAFDYLRFVDSVEGKEISEATRQTDKQFGALGKPLGVDVVGVVEEVGEDISHLKKGDGVFAIASGLIGGWAEYALANDGEVCLKPSNLTFEEAASFPCAALTALGALRLGNTQKGQHLLITGATGGVGLFAVQLAKFLGLTVTGICSTRNQQLVRQMGADFILDYKKEDILKNGNKYDCIIANNGYQTLEEYKELLNPNGTYIPLSNRLLGEAMTQGAAVFTDSRTLKPFLFPMWADKEMSFLKELIEAEMIVPTIDKIYSIHNISKAIVDIIQDHPQGKVIINMDF